MSAPVSWISLLDSLEQGRYSAFHEEPHPHPSDRHFAQSHPFRMDGPIRPGVKMTYRIHGTDAGVTFDTGEVPWDQLPDHTTTVHIVGFRTRSVVGVLATKEAADGLAAALLADEDWEGLEVLSVPVQDSIDPATLANWS